MAWIELGRAHWILDNLIASGLAMPMLLVMPDGEFEYRSQVSDRASDRTEILRQDLFDGVLPLVRRHYRMDEGRARRGILGVSRGGGEALHIGLRDPDVFSWIGGFSSAMMQRRDVTAQALGQAETINTYVKALVIACGSREFLLSELNRRFHENLVEREIHHEFHSVEGTHGWPLWIPLFADFVRKIFR